MVEIKLNLEEELAAMLNQIAQKQKVSAEDFIVQILNKYFALAHTINQEEMAKGYQEMGELNLALSK